MTACSLQVSISNFKDFFDDYRGLFSSMLVKLQVLETERERSLDKQQRELIELYSVFVFKKVKNENNETNETEKKAAAAAAAATTSTPTPDEDQDDTTGSTATATVTATAEDSSSTLTSLPAAKRQRAAAD